MHHGGDARAVNPRQSVNLVNQRHAFPLVIGAAYQVRHPVDHHQMNTPVQVMVLIHALHDSRQSLAP